MVSLRTPRVLGAASVIVLLAGCSASEPADTSDSMEQAGAGEVVATSTGRPLTTLGVREFPPGESWEEAVQPLIVRVSNQAFDDPKVRLRASLDGVDLFDQGFAVENQHTVTLFGVDVGPGSHTLTVVSDSGAEARQTFDLPPNEQRWLVVDYWYFDPAKEGDPWGGKEEPGPSLQVSVSREPAYIA